MDCALARTQINYALRDWIITMGRNKSAGHTEAKTNNTQTVAQTKGR